MSKRDQLIQTTYELFERQGYHATGLNQIIRESQTPKGSLYHYFPEGKEELAANAVTIRGRFVAERFQEAMQAAATPAEGVRDVLLTISERMQAANCQAGAPLAAVALETSGQSERLRLACEEAYTTWCQIFRMHFEESGFSADRAQKLATLVVSSIEGAMILGRVQRNSAPLEELAETLYELIEKEE